MCAVVLSAWGRSVKSVTNPDKRVTIIKEFAKAHFVATPLLDFALEVRGVPSLNSARVCGCSCSTTGDATRVDAEHASLALSG